MSQIIQGDYQKLLPSMQPGTVDVVITSPRYNFGKNYPGVNDHTSNEVYFKEMRELATGTLRVTREDGACFINVGTRAADPLHDMQVAQEFIKAGWTLQERIIWQKADEEGNGHFTPINSEHHLNNLWESIFLFTKTGKVQLDRLAIGIPYKDQANIKRWKHGKSVHCRGDIWFIKYETIQDRGRDRQGHEATFPRELVVRCLRLIECGRKGLRVLDPCCGTGTVPCVAVEQGHEGVGFDLSEDMAASARMALEMAFRLQALPVTPDYLENPSIYGVAGEVIREGDLIACDPKTGTLMKARFKVEDSNG